MKKIQKPIIYIILFFWTVLWILQLFWFNIISISAGILSGNTSEKSSKFSINIDNASLAYFSAWCFWCAESSFEKYSWIFDVISWYAGWEEISPDYKSVASGKTGHRETVKVLYDPNLISYNDLLQIFWRTANPTDSGWQYVDRGFQYTSAIFYSNTKEKQIAEESKKNISQNWIFNKDIVTPIIPFTSFYAAEEYHQDYYKVNPVRYNVYTNGSGRKQFLEKTWGDNIFYTISNQRDLKSKLTPLQYKVTQEWGTEKPFDNEYWDTKEAGIYVDIVDGSPLYSSLDKYVSGTGWPSFTKPISPEVVSEHEDNSLFYKRTEIKSASSNSHVWHVFTDGPIDKWWLRYCMNSAAMKFIPVDKLEKEGYGEYVEMFQ
jgi:peptide methionine sulfoxide reductase msrA/msrB